jgi:uncharacterized protein involved in exopolysaccharide biosynthesis
MEQEGKSLIDVVEAIFRQRNLVLITIAAILAVCVAYALLAKSQFGSTMKILVQNSRANTLVGPESGVSMPGEMNSDMMESKINSEVELLQSSDLLEGLVHYRDQLRGMKSPEHGSVMLALETRALQHNLEVIPIRKTNMIQVSFLDTDPVIAQKSLQWLAAQFLNKHVDLQRSGATYEFFESQAQQAASQLGDAEAKLIEFDKTTGVTSPEQEHDLSQQRQSLNSRDVEEVRAALNADEARLAQLRQQETTTPARVETLVKSASNAGSTERLDTLLAELQNKRIELLTRYKPDDRLVVEVDSQIANTKAALSNINGKQAAETTEDVNPVLTLIHEDIEKVAANVLAERARLAAMTQTSTAYQSRLQQLQQISMQRDILTRRVQELKENLKKFTEKRDDLQVDSELDKIKLMDVAVAQEPTLSNLPMGPHRKMIIVLGVVLACFLAVGVVLAKEALRETMYAPYELEAIASSPLLATVPEISLRSPSLPALGRGIGIGPSLEKLKRPAEARMRSLR